MSNHAGRIAASKKAWAARKKMAEARAVAQASQPTDSVTVDEPVKIDLTGDEAHNPIPLHR